MTYFLENARYFNHFFKKISSRFHLFTSIASCSLELIAYLVQDTLTR